MLAQVSTIAIWRLLCCLKFSPNYKKTNKSIILVLQNEKKMNWMGLA